MTDGWSAPDSWASPTGPPPSAHLPAPGAVPTWADTGQRPIVPLRPLTVGEILDGAVTLVRRNPRVLLGLGALAAAVSGAASILSAALSDSSTSDSQIQPTALLGSLVSYVIGIALSGATAVTLRAGLMGEPLAPGEVLARVRARLGTLIGASMLAGLFAVLGLILLILPGIYLYIGYTFTGAIVVLEGAGVRASLKRSRTLVKGAWWRTFGIVILVLLIVAVIGAVAAVPAGIALGASSALSTGSTTGLDLASQAIVIALTSLTTVITAPFQAGALSLLYVDRRMRVEGLDVALLQARAARQG